ncbi:MAG TPA: glycosyltransferase family 4 protein, partial [Solirubrobacteraceae bacterium]
MTAAPRVVCACDWLVKYTAGLTRGLADAGAEAVLLTRDHDLEFGGQAGALRDHARAVLGPDVPHLVLPGRPRQLGPYREAIRLRRSLHRFAPDVVHLQSSVVNDPRLVLVAGARPGRYALTVHDVTRHPGDPEASGLRRRLEERLVRGAGVTFVHAERLAEDLRRRYGPVPTAVVPHGVDVPSPRPLPAREA